MRTAPGKVSSYRTVESPRNKRLIIAQPSAELKQGAHQHYLSGFSLSQNNLLKIPCTVSATPPNNVFSQHRSLPDPHSSESPGGVRSPAGSHHVLSLPGFHPECRHWAVEDRGRKVRARSQPATDIQADACWVSFLGASQGPWASGQVLRSRNPAGSAGAIISPAAPLPPYPPSPSIRGPRH